METRSPERIADLESIACWQRARLCAVARRLLRDEHEAEDAVQDALLLAWRALDRFEGRAQLSTWLYRLVVNSSLMRLRGQRRRREVLCGEWQDAIPLEPAGAETAHRSIEVREARDRVRRALEHLPIEQRRVIFLRDLCELDAPTAARLIGTTEGALKMRKHRARRALRTLLSIPTPKRSHGRTPGTPKRIR